MAEAKVVVVVVVVVEVVVVVLGVVVAVVVVDITRSLPSSQLLEDNGDAPGGAPACVTDCPLIVCFVHLFVFIFCPLIVCLVHLFVCLSSFLPSDCLSSFFPFVFFAICLFICLPFCPLIVCIVHLRPYWGRSQGQGKKG